MRRDIEEDEDMPTCAMFVAFFFFLPFLIIFKVFRAVFALAGRLLRK